MRQRLPFRARVAMAILHRAWPEGEGFLLEGLVAAAACAQKAGEVVVGAERLAKLEADARAYHRLLWPRAVRYGRPMDELLFENDLAEACCAIEGGDGEQVETGG